MRSSGKGKAGGVLGAAAVMLLATPFIAGWEGKRNEAYLDRIASPPVWTVCYGETDPKFAYKGAKYTDKQCTDMLYNSVSKYYERLAGCMSAAVPVSVQASLLELAYNAGTGAACGSTAMRQANAGNYAAACDAVTMWVKAGGKTIKGLVNRRNASRDMCMRDVK